MEQYSDILRRLASLLDDDFSVNVVRVHDELQVVLSGLVPASTKPEEESK